MALLALTSCIYSFLKWQAQKAPTGYMPSDLTFRGRPVITSVWWEVA
jgi:hypothetical protein